VPRRYLTLEDALAIHADLISRWGGLAGVRDAGALEAALYRPQTGYYPDLIGEAAALWESISQNHPFVDGNKRAAFALMFVFLRLNGCDLRVSDAEAQVFVLALYANGTFNFEHLRDWLAQTVIEPTR